MKKIVLILCATLFVPLLAFGQINPQDLSVGITPELPEPGGQVIVDVESFVADLDRSEIRWSLDGTELTRAVGAKEVGFTAGPIGTVHRLTITAVTPNSGTLSKTITIAPATVDLIWEATDSYTCLLYTSPSPRD